MYIHYLNRCPPSSLSSRETRGRITIYKVRPTIVYLYQLYAYTGPMASNSLYVRTCLRIFVAPNHYMVYRYCSAPRGHLHTFRRTEEQRTETEAKREKERKTTPDITPIKPYALCDLHLNTIMDNATRAPVSIWYSNGRSFVRRQFFDRHDRRIDSVLLQLMGTGLRLWSLSLSKWITGKVMHLSVFCLLMRYHFL